MSWGAADTFGEAAGGAARGRSVWTSWPMAAEPMARGIRNAIFLMLDIVADRSLSAGEQG